MQWGTGWDEPTTHVSSSISTTTTTTTTVTVNAFSSSPLTSSSNLSAGSDKAYIKEDASQRLLSPSNQSSYEKLSFPVLTSSAPVKQTSALSKPIADNKDSIKEETVIAYEIPENKENNLLGIKEGLGEILDKVKFQMCKRLGIYKEGKNRPVKLWCNNSQEAEFLKKHKLRNGIYFRKEKQFSHYYKKRDTSRNINFTPNNPNFINSVFHPKFMTDLWQNRALILQLHSIVLKLYLVFSKKEQQG